MASGGMWKWKIWHFKHLRSAGLETWPLTLQGFLPWTGWTTEKNSLLEEELIKIFTNMRWVSIKRMSALMQTLTRPWGVAHNKGSQGLMGLIGNLKAPNGHQSYIMSPATFFNVLRHYYMPTFHYALILPNAFHSAPSCAIQLPMLASATQHSSLLLFWFSFPRSGLHTDARSQMPDFRSGPDRLPLSTFPYLAG